MKIEQSETVSPQWNWKLAGSKLTRDIQVYVVKGDKKKRTASIRLLLKRFNGYVHGIKLNCFSILAWLFIKISDFDLSAVKHKLIGRDLNPTSIHQTGSWEINVCSTAWIFKLDARFWRDALFLYCLFFFLTVNQILLIKFISHAKDIRVNCVNVLGKIIMINSSALWFVNAYMFFTL